MKRFPCVILLFCLLLTLCGCGGSDIPSVAESYTGQSTMRCTLHYTVGMEALINGVEIDLLEQVYTADVEIDRSAGMAHLLGEMVTYIDGEAMLTSTLESYSIPSDPDACSFYRYDDMYCADALENAYLSIVEAPLSLDLSGYTEATQSEILYGSVCRCYTGQEISGSEDQMVMNGSTATPLSTAGCLMDVVLRVYEETSLPAQLQINYSNLADMGLCFADASGNSYQLTSLRYEVVYNSYGTPVSVDLPEGFRTAALNGQAGFATPALDETLGALGSIEDAIGGEVSNYTGQFYGDYSDHHFIYSSDRTHFFAVATPEFSQLDNQTLHRLSFSYGYSEEDFELIDYVFVEDTSDTDQEAYTATLLATYEEGGTISDLSHSELLSMTIGDYDVKYMVYYYTIELSGVVYDTVDVYSWAMAPGGKECVEVTVIEYNGTGDGWMIDPAEELLYAYSAVSGYGTLD